MISHSYILAMTAPLRIVGLGVVGLVALWIVLEIVAVVFGIVTWIVSTVVSLAILALLLYIGYIVVTNVLS